MAPHKTASSYDSTYYVLRSPQPGARVSRPFGCSPRACRAPSNFASCPRPPFISRFRLAPSRTAGPGEPGRRGRQADPAWLQHAAGGPSDLHGAIPAQGRQTPPKPLEMPARRTTTRNEATLTEAFVMADSARRMPSLPTPRLFSLATLLARHTASMAPRRLCSSREDFCSKRDLHHHVESRCLPLSPPPPLESRWIPLGLAGPRCPHPGWRGPRGIACWNGD